MQSTKSDTPQSPTIKQAQTDMTPKYEDLRAYYTKPSFEFEKQFGFLLKPPANDGIIDDENSGFTIKSIPKIAIIIAVI